MLNELTKCPMLFASCKSSVVVMARMCDDAKRFGVWASTVDNKGFKVELAESDLQQIKDKADRGLSWERFFEQLQTSFNTGKVDTEDGCTITCAFAVEGQTAVFNLSECADDVQKLCFDALLTYHYVHTHSRDVEKQLEEGAKKEKELGQQAAELEKEENDLQTIIERSKVQDKTNREKLAQLEKDLDEVTRAMPNASEIREEDDTCRARIPLIGKDHVDYDVELLKLVKSGYIVADDAADLSAPCHSVVRPYTKSELAQQTTTFSSEQREKLWQCLQNIDSWEYSCFEAQTLMAGDDHNSLVRQHQGGSLFLTMYALMVKHQMMQKFNLDEQIVVNWLSAVESGYHGNSYHNSMHAADVLQVLHFILTKGGMIEKCNLTDEDVFAALFSAAIHDYDHPGINNSFHMRTNSYYATLYNDRSILENRHVSSVFELMKLQKWNILASVSDDQRRDIRDTIIEMVLATDMGLHGKYFANWKKRLDENHVFKKKDDIRLGLAMCLKMADISNCGRPHHLYKRWGEKIADEFYMQGDREKAFGLSKSPFMDRDQPGLASGQISFMNYVVIPMFESISTFLPSMTFTVKQTESNRQYWQQHPEL